MPLVVVQLVGWWARSSVACTIHKFVGYPGLRSVLSRRNEVGGHSVLTPEHPIFGKHLGWLSVSTCECALWDWNRLGALLIRAYNPSQAVEYVALR